MLEIPPVFFSPFVGKTFVVGKELVVGFEICGILRIEGLFFNQLKVWRK
jgi:hypothetical protein